MEKRLRGLASSWFFAPYLGSADLDFFKRIKDTPIDYKVVQVKRVQKDERVLGYVSKATLERVEVVTDHANPRTRRTRDAFTQAVVEEFRRAPDSYDFIISHSNEVPSHAAALQLKRAYPGVPWIAYFGDVISKNPYLKYIGEYPLSAEDDETEALTLQHADLVIVNNEYQKQLMFAGELSRYAHKAVVIPHCYDPAMYPEAPGTPNARFTLMHLGTLYHVKRTAEPLLRAVDRLIEIYPQYRSRFEVVFYGSSVTSHDISVHAFMRNRNHVRFEDSIPYLDSLRRMREADALILIDGVFSAAEDKLEFNPFFPGKLTDYMGAEKPMFAITMERGPTADLLRESGNLVADTRVDRIAYVLKRYIDRKVTPDTAPYRRFRCANVSAQMEEAIRRTVKAARSSPAPTAGKPDSAAA